jgi:hypothetical protein
VNFRKYWTLLIVCIAMLALASGVAAAQAPKPQDDPNMKEIFNYTLTMDKIHRLTAVEVDMTALLKEHPEMQKQMDSDSSDCNLRSAGAKDSEISAGGGDTKEGWIVAAGIYIVGTLAVIQAGMAVSFKKSGAYKDYPPKLLTTINPANLAFVEKNWDNISKSMPAFQSKDDGSASK